MAEEGKKSYSNIFIANTIYPEAKSIFSFHLEPIEKVKDDCYIVLDTNVLLAPYIIGKEDLLEQCRKTYNSLVAAKRLVIPGQVVREFAKNRQEKLAELHQQLILKKQGQSLKLDNYPLLSPLDEFRELRRLGEEVSKKISEYQRSIDKVLAIIQGWHWNDPVSMLYHEIFTEETVVDIQVNEDEIRKDLNTRQQHDIPPGYKDAGKKDEGVGDLLIWYTILEVGRLHNNSVIFVTGEEKADWYKKSSGQPLYPRYELVDEFRRESGGYSFHMVKFSRFLELYGATEKVVEEIKREEIILNTQIVVNEALMNWVKDLLINLKSIDRELSSFSIDYLDLQVGETSTAKIYFLYKEFLYLYDTIPSSLIDRIIGGDLNLIKLIIHSLLERRIYIDGGKSIKELASQAVALREVIRSVITALERT